jgi:hypothetical protein
MAGKRFQAGRGVVGEYRRVMAPDPNADDVADRVADESLLTEDPASLPVAIGRPVALPESRTRARLVGLGATLTGVTLIAGIVLVALGAIQALSSGIDLAGIAALAIGGLLLGTHWGWVHVAEASADALEHRRNRDIIALRQHWLETIEPYTRYEVSTSVADDGSITIDRIQHRPVPAHPGVFRFVRAVEHTEVHSGDEAAAAIAERAELLRRQASLDTERERQRFQVAADASERRRLGQGDEAEELSARRAASQALSEQINSNLRDPPLTE